MSKIIALVRRPDSVVKKYRALNIIEIDSGTSVEREITCSGCDDVIKYLFLSPEVCIMLRLLEEKHNAIMALYEQYHDFLIEIQNKLYEEVLPQLVIELYLKDDAKEWLKLWIADQGEPQFTSPVISLLSPP